MVPFKPLGHWQSICLFLLWCALAGLMFAFKEIGLAAVFFTWNVVRLVLSPFLRFVLTRSWVLVSMSVFVLLIFAAISLAPSLDVKYFAAVSLILTIGSAVVLILLLQKPQLEILIGKFTSTREGI